jgi:phenylpropionate dioxygenase-like ring-hydroxylating dioxygenase large terminal subunit
VLYHCFAVCPFLRIFADARASQADTAEAESKDSSTFNWFKQWYPIGVVTYLDEGRPHSIQLLGRDFVLWYSQTDKQWSVLADACPHRLAPLSEGRVEPDGTLLCAYHAWRFDARGACVKIPQVRPLLLLSVCKVHVHACARSSIIAPCIILFPSTQSAR